jgi:prevent-host-death family protein
MNVATNPTPDLPAEVGVRELKNHLSAYLDRVRAGEDILVTERGRPIARLTSIDDAAARLAELVRQGVVRPPQRSRHRPRPVSARGTVSDLAADQRR